ncbi:MAG TPA: hypothetical protein P5116_07250, partial [Eubacteriales bacterium]|nr:hypothetical protein [Eubacteriales bacterium]
MADGMYRQAHLDRLYFAPLPATNDAGKLVLADGMYRQAYLDRLYFAPLPATNDAGKLVLADDITDLTLPAD